MHMVWIRVQIWAIYGVFDDNWRIIFVDSGYPHNGHADKNPYPHDHRADKDSYPHDSNNQCIILRLQLSFVMIKCAIDACLIYFILFFDIFLILQQIYVNIIIFICTYNYVEDPQMIQLLLYVAIAIGNSAFFFF